MNYLSALMSNLSKFPGAKSIYSDGTSVVWSINN